MKTHGLKYSCIHCKKQFNSNYLNKHYDACKASKLANKQFGIDFVRCSICSLPMKEINTAHLQKHGTNATEYDRIYGNNRLSQKSLIKKATLCGPSEKHKKSHTEAAYIEKYGHDEGRKKFELRKKASWWPKTEEGFIERFGEVEGRARYEKGRKIRKKAFSKEGYINRFGESEGNKKWEELLAKRKKEYCLEGYIEKYGEIQGTAKWRNKNLKNSQSSISVENSEDFITYCRAVKRFTNLSLSKVPNINQRNRQNHLDHKISKAVGFINNIPPYIIGSRYNLEVLTAKDNCSKQTKCSISIEELFEKYENQFRSNKPKLS